MASKPRKQAKKGKKGKKGKRRSARAALATHTNPHKVREFDDFWPTGVVNNNAATIRSTLTAWQKSLELAYPLPSNYISIIRIQPPKSRTGILSADCGCGCS
jgi:hypothetical protein